MGGDGKGPGIPSDQDPNCDRAPSVGLVVVSVKPVRQIFLKDADVGVTGKIFRYVVTYRIAWKKKAASTMDPKKIEKGNEIVIIA
jgi:hypothetical protein